VADIAILGENVVVESGKNIKVLEKLGFSKCRLSIAVPKGFDYRSLKDLEGKKIATSYPNTLRNYLEKNGVNADIHVISGSVEIAPNIGLADAICDIVSSGSTLFNNGLKEVEQLLKSEAALVASPALDEEKQQLLEDLLFRMRSVLRARRSKYILLNAPNDKLEEISKILPVLKSPTVLPLMEEGWSSIHSVINEGDFWNVIDRLKALGAQGILVIPIEKMVV
jgi:ATP phosphoribosyltransferase